MEKEKKKKSKLKIIIPIVVVVIIAIVVFTNNTGGISGLANNNEEMLQQAEILDWTTVHNEVKDNPAKSEDYEGKLYFYYGTIYEIHVDNVKILNSKDVNSLNSASVSSDRYIYVYLDKEEIKKLNKNDTIYVIGTLEKENSSWVAPCNLKNSILLDTETVKNNFIMGLTEEKSSGYGANNKYSDYEYNKETGLITSYKQSGDTNGTHILSYDNSKRIVENILQYTISSYGSEKTTYTYDENNNILTEDIIEIKDGIETPKQHWDYTYVLDEQNRVVKKTGINTLGDNYTMTYEFTYDENNNIIEELQTSSNSTYKIRYEYDKLGNKIKSISSRVDKVASSSTDTYTYFIIGKK